MATLKGIMYVCISCVYNYHTRYNNIFYYIEYCIEFGPLDWPQGLHLKCEINYIYT